MPYGWSKSVDISVIIDADAGLNCDFPFTDSRFPTESLQLTINYLLDSAYSENSWRQQNSAKLNFFYFLHTFGLLVTKQRLSLNRYLPEHISSVMWSGYHAHMYRAEYKWNTITQYTMLVRNWLMKGGREDPTTLGGEPDHAFWNLYRAMKRKLHGDKKERFPISYSHLYQLYVRCITGKDNQGVPITGLDKQLAANLWLCFSMMFHGLLRTSELNTKNKAFRPELECSRADITLFEAAGQTSYSDTDIKSSKTTPDPTRQGFKLRLYATGKALCPVLALKRLWKLDHSRSSTRPLLDYRTQAERAAGRPVRADRAALTKWITKLLEHSGINDKIELKAFTTHSFRSGAASELAIQNVSVETIRNAGRWKSDAVRVYIENVQRNPEAIKGISDLLANSAIVKLSF